MLLLVTALVVSNAQEQPFSREIQQLRKEDSLRGYPMGKAILFIGSSSFTLWKDVNDAFPGYGIVNHAFGGSTLLDVIHYVKEIVPVSHTRQIVIYCGENDLASSDTVTGAIVAERFKLLFYLLRRRIKDVPIVYVSMKPSPSRQLLQPEMIKGNALIRDFLKKKKNTAFVDVYKQMIDDEGRPLDELFGDDKLHMNKNGYAIWQRTIAPYLKK